MPLLLVAHPSPDVYGSDLQLLQTVLAARAGGWAVCVTVPTEGPLRALLEATGARVVVDPRTAVLRKSALSPRGLLGLLVQSGRNVRAGTRALRRTGADVLLVNTMTLPAWLVAGRLARVPVVCHVHEAENRLPGPVRRLLVAPLRLARPLVVNSAATAQALTSADPALDRHLVVVHNGVPDEPGTPVPLRARAADDVARLVVVGRLSPRKGTDVALAAVALLRARGHRVVLDVCGTAFTGYEWFARDLEARAARPDLAGAVTFHGYVPDTGPLLARADVVLVPSLGESFGNVAVEALLAERPLVASAAQALEEIVVDGQTGLLVPPGDAAALAGAIESLLGDPEAARAMAVAGRADARARFGAAAYHAAMREVLDGALRGSAAPRPATRPARTTPPRIHVAIPTFRRPAMLRDAVDAVARHVSGLPGLAARTEILVVDNSPDGDAQPTAQALRAAHPAIPVRYVHEPRPGIGAARARAVSEADADGLVVFIDDDGLPGERWLAPLVETWERTGAELVAGAILPGYAEPPSAWMIAGGFFERPVPPTGTTRRSAPSGNLLIDVAGVSALGVEFDAGRGLRGGEDTLFTRSVTAAGGRIVSCAEAEVVDLVPVERTTRRWLVSRVFSHANNAVAIDAHFAGSAPQRARVHAAAVARGLAVTGRGAVRWLRARASGDEGADARAWLDLARGPGLVVGGLGGRHEAYRR